MMGRLRGGKRERVRDGRRERVSRGKGGKRDRGRGGSTEEDIEEGMEGWRKICEGEGMEEWAEEETERGIDRE